MAKLRSDQIKQHTKKPLASIYLVTGDEPLIAQEVTDELRRAAKAQGFIERELHHTDSGFQWVDLHNSASSMSLFAEKKLIEIRIHNAKPGDAGSKAIIGFCQNFASDPNLTNTPANNDTMLLLVCPKIDKRSQSSKWYKTIEQFGHIVTVWPITAAQLPRWIDQRLNANHLQADSHAIDILAAKVEGNLLAAAQEIEKLKLLANKNVISSELMNNAVTDSSRYSVFNLVDKILIGDSRKAINTLHGLRTEGVEPAIVLWALTKEVRSLNAIQEAMANGQSFERTAKQNGIWDNRQSIIKQAIKRFQLKDLQQFLRQAANIDQTIKGAKKGDIWNLLLDLCLGLSGTQTFTAKSQKMALRKI